MMHNLNIANWNDPHIMVDITGKTTPNGGLLRKLDLTHQQGWNKTYGGTNDEVAYSVVQTCDGGYALTGITWTSTGSIDRRCICFSSGF